MKQIKLTLDHYPESWKKRAMAGEDLRIPGTSDYNSFLQQMTVMDPAYANACTMQFVKSFKQTYDGFESIPKGPARAEKVYNEFGKKLNRSLFARKQRGDAPISCGAKCSACCTIRVTLSDSEADHLVAYAKARKIPLDKEHLLRQDNAKTDDDFVELPYEDRQCTFLDEEGNCRVYEARPLVCRRFMVTSPSWMCDTRRSDQTLMVIDPVLEGFVSAIIALEASKDMAEHNLPTQLLKRISDDDGLWKSQPLQPEQ